MSATEIEAKVEPASYDEGSSLRTRRIAFEISAGSIILSAWRFGPPAG